MSKTNVVYVSCQKNRDVLSRYQPMEYLPKALHWYTNYTILYELYNNYTNYTILYELYNNLLRYFYEYLYMQKSKCRHVLLSWMSTQLVPYLKKNTHLWHHSTFFTPGVTKNRRRNRTSTFVSLVILFPDPQRASIQVNALWHYINSLRLLGTMVAKKSGSVLSGPVSPFSDRTFWLKK